MAYSYANMVLDFFSEISWPLIILILGLVFGARLLKAIQSFIDNIDEGSFGSAKWKMKRRATDRLLMNTGLVIESKLDASPKATSTTLEDVVGLGINKDIFRKRADELLHRMLDAGATRDVLSRSITLLDASRRELAERENVVLSDLGDPTEDEDLFRWFDHHFSDRGVSGLLLRMHLAWASAQSTYAMMYEGNDKKEPSDLGEIVGKSLGGSLITLLSASAQEPSN